MKELNSKFFEKKIKKAEEDLKSIKDSLVGIDQLSMARSEQTREEIKDFKKISEIIDRIDFEKIIETLQQERKIEFFFEKKSYD